MFWDKVSGVYDLFENIYNKSVYQSTGETVAKYIKDTDSVLECACGTGAISMYIAPVCNTLFASDYSIGMLKQAQLVKYLPEEMQGKFVEHYEDTWSQNGRKNS